MHVCACMCMYVHVCACMCMYVHVCACICMHVSTWSSGDAKWPRRPPEPTRSATRSTPPPESSISRPVNPEMVHFKTGKSRSRVIRLGKFSPIRLHIVYFGAVFIIRFIYLSFICTDNKIKRWHIDEIDSWTIFKRNWAVFFLKYAKFLHCFFQR
jgi:hypothetical protein